MAMDKKKTKKILGITGVVAGIAFIGLKVLASLRQGDSQYSYDPEHQNSLEGKKVFFVPD